MRQQLQELDAQVAALAAGLQADRGRAEQALEALRPRTVHRGWEPRRVVTLRESFSILPWRGAGGVGPTNGASGGWRIA